MSTNRTRSQLRPATPTFICSKLNPSVLNLLKTIVKFLVFKSSKVWFCSQSANVSWRQQYHSLKHEWVNKKLKHLKARYKSLKNRFPASKRSVSFSSKRIQRWRYSTIQTKSQMFTRHQRMLKLRQLQKRFIKLHKMSFSALWISSAMNQFL